MAKCSDKHGMRSSIHVDYLRIYLNPEYPISRTRPGQFHSSCRPDWRQHVPMVERERDGKLVRAKQAEEKCQVANQFKPKTLVYRGVKASGTLDGHAKRPYTKSAERIVLVLERDEDDSFIGNYASIPELVSKNIKEVLLILHTTAPGEIYGPPEPAPNIYSRRSHWFGEFLSFCVRFMKQHEVKFRIINAGALSPKDMHKEEEKKMDYEEVETEFEKRIKQAMTNQGVKGEYEVVGMKTWLEEGDWEGVYERRDISGWLSAIGDPLADYVDGTEVPVGGKEVEADGGVEANSDRGLSDRYPSEDPNSDDGY
jgi:hypothetical protein